MHPDKYKLTWHSYPDYLREMMREMMTSGDFTDVTLVTDDKKTIKAHRNILSACSPVFKNILQMETHNSHPVIYLRGIKYPEIESILQFIYLGEAKFYEERMNEFLSVSKNLEIRELNKDVEMEEPAPSNPNPADITDTVDVDHKNINEVKEGSMIESEPIINVKKVIINKYACNQCDKHYTQQWILTRHIQSAHEGVKYACNQCDQQYAEHRNLIRHIQSEHEGVKYACDQCDYQAPRQDNLTRHNKAKHL